MRSLLPVVMGVVALTWLSAGPASPAPPDGKAMFEARCGMCHGRDGVPPRGFAKKNAPDFTDRSWQDSRTDEALSRAIEDGVKGTMMRGFGKTLRPEEIAAVVKHLRTLAPKED